MVVLAQQPISMDYRKPRKHAEFQLKWQLHQFPIKAQMSKKRKIYGKSNRLPLCECSKLVFLGVKMLLLGN